MQYTSLSYNQYLEIWSDLHKIYLTKKLFIGIEHKASNLTLSIGQVTA